MSVVVSGSSLFHYSVIGKRHMIDISTAFNDNDNTFSAMWLKK